MRYHFLVLALALPIAACQHTANPGRPVSIALPPEATIATYYQRVETRLRNAGLMRTDTNPRDAQFTYADLVRDFREIALFDEYGVDDGVFVPRRSPSYLRRWVGPISVGIQFGASVPTEQRARDREVIAEYARRLQNLTGVPISMTQSSRANLLFLVLNEAEQRTAVRNLPGRFRYPGAAVIDAIQNSPRDVFCAAFAYSNPQRRGEYESALILVKAEHGDLMRKSCVHEEMAQAMGLTNDSNSARPSIFNDDEEFALLTVHDEILLQMLYDPRLWPGMTEAEALPLLEEIARDAAGFGS